MIMISDATLTTTTPKAVPAWMHADNFSQVVNKNIKKEKKHLFRNRK